MDRIADHLGLDPAEMRKKYVVPPNSITANWIRIGSFALGQCIDKVVAGAGGGEKVPKRPYGKGKGDPRSAHITGRQTPIYFKKVPPSRGQIKMGGHGGRCVFFGARG